jgi:hypothetical protein
MPGCTVMVESLTSLPSDKILLRQVRKLYPGTSFLREKHSPILRVRKENASVNVSQQIQRIEEICWIQEICWQP